MNSYRTLTYQEFDILQDDFVQFLYQEGFSRFEFRILQEEYSEFAIDLLNRYSDLAFEKVMRDVLYLEYKDKNQLIVFFCAQDHFDIFGLRTLSSNLSHLDETELSDCIKNKELGTFKTFHKKMPYKTKREYEIFDLIECGHQVVSAKNYQLVKELRQSSQN